MKEKSSIYLIDFREDYNLTTGEILFFSQKINISTFIIIYWLKFVVFFFILFLHRLFIDFYFICISNVINASYIILIHNYIYIYIFFYYILIQKIFSKHTHTRRHTF